MTIPDLYHAGRALAERWARPTIARLPLSPSAWTVGGMLLQSVAAALLAIGSLPWAGGLILLGGFFDVADGATARATGRQSRLGAFLDATLDRYGEVLNGLGLLVYLLQWGGWLDQLLLYLFVGGSLIFSYTRARAEAEGFTGRTGLFDRLVRVLVLAIGLLLGQVRVTLWILSVGVWIGALQRFGGVCLEARRSTPREGRCPLSR